MLPFIISALRSNPLGNYPYADIYIIDGQSNSVGRGANAELLSYLNTVCNKRLIWAFDEFQPIQIGVNNNGYGLEEDASITTSYFGSEFEFSFRMQNYLQHPIWIVKVGQGNRMLDTGSGQVNLSDFNIASIGQLHDYMLEKVSDAIAWISSHTNKTPRLKAYLWSQGENDGYSSGHADNYLNNLYNKFNAVRSDLGYPNLPIIYNHLPDFQINITFRSTIWSAQEFMATYPNNYMYLSDNFDQRISPQTGQPDHLHFSGLGQCQKGYAEFKIAKNL